VSHPDYSPPVYKDTNLNCTFNYLGVNRLLGCDYQKARVLATTAPKFDQIFIIAMIQDMVVVVQLPLECPQMVIAGKMFLFMN